MTHGLGIRRLYALLLDEEQLRWLNHALKERVEGEAEVPELVESVDHLLAIIAAGKNPKGRERVIEANGQPSVHVVEKRT